ncbi:hypothetical protein A1353_24115 [Methylomonas methanica]|uniref:DUF6602 domain-containing protein n=2 Tax=Methylomonas methanica TaxID=421 RepID=A0A177LTE4_METMH|nr:hypothetical protein A1353_24115 [Methylomonas methanica]
MLKYKHKHGEPNLIIQQEEKAILLAVDRALNSTTNSQIIGRNGEIPLIQFLNRYLPPTLKAASGHFITPSGNLSPQIDIMILDSRYPLLSQNTDGSVLAMLHSLIECVEVKTNLTSKDVKKSWSDSVSLTKLASEIDGYGGSLFGAIGTKVLAYRCAPRLGGIQNAFERFGKPFESSLDIIIIRYPEKDQPLKYETGGELHFEPIFDTEDSEKIGVADEFVPILSQSFTPLSDFYYRLVQLCYYTLDARNFSFGDIGEHFMQYMSWSTIPMKTL